jgi:hypothetical protein
MRVSYYSGFGCYGGGALMVVLKEQAKGYGRRIAPAIRSSWMKTSETTFCFIAG